MNENHNVLAIIIEKILPSIWSKNTFSFFILTVILSSCNNQTNSAVNQTSAPNNQNKEINFDKGIYCGLLDSDDVLWFGSNGGGIYRYDGASFTNLSEVDGLCNNQVYSIIEDKKGHLWLGTANGLCKYDGKTFTHIPIPFSDTSSIWLDKVYPLINPNAVHSLIQDTQGDFWIGTGGGGAYRYDGVNFTSFLTDIGRKQEDSLYHNWIPSIAEDDAGNIWFASMTHGGVSQFDGKKLTHFMPKDGLTDDMIRTIFKDKSGKLWFGYNGNRNSGLTCYDGKSFVNFYEKDGLCNTRIRRIYEDKKGNIWLGADLGNLCIYDGKTFKEFKSKDGKPVTNVLFILEDGKGNIWFGGKNGLSKFDGNTLIKMTNR